MTRTTWLKVSGFKSRDELIRILNKIGIQSDRGVFRELSEHWSWECRFESSDSRWRALRDAAERTGHRSLYGERLEYSNEEVAQAELLWLQLSEVTARGDTGPSFGSEYDLSVACDLCLSGAKLVPPLVISAADLPRSRLITETHAGEILVASDLAEALRLITPESLIPVEDRKSKRALPWRFVRPEHTLPRWSDRTHGMRREQGLGYPWDSCAKCGRDCHGPSLTDATQLVYRRSEIVQLCGGLPKVAATWELMGPGTRAAAGGRPQVAQPCIVVGADFGAVLRKHANRWIRLSPVVLE